MFLLPLVVAMFLAGSVNADFGSAMAFYNKGDYVAALAEFNKLAAAGDPAAMNNLGMMYANGQGAKQDYATARGWYEKSAKLGNPDAMNNLGVMYELGQGTATDFTQARQWYEKASKWGLATAQYNLAELYANGTGVDKDPVEAYVWYTLAAVRGDQDAGKKRDEIAKGMNANQVALAKQKLAKLGIK
jgi:TPR repeat protein